MIEKQVFFFFLVLPLLKSYIRNGVLNNYWTDFQIADVYSLQ